MMAGRRGLLLILISAAMLLMLWESYAHMQRAKAAGDDRAALADRYPCHLRLCHHLEWETSAYTYGRSL